MSGAHVELIIGLILLLPSIRFLIWVNTSSDAGYLMILGVFIALGAFLLVIAGTVLVFGGVWRFWPLPDPAVGRALGAGVGVLLALRFWNWRRRPRRRA